MLMDKKVHSGPARTPLLESWLPLQPRSGYHVPPVLLGSFARFFFIACQPATAVPDSATPNPAASERDFEAGTIIQIALARVRGYLGQSGRVGACTFALRRGGGCRLAVVVAVALGAKTFQKSWPKGS